MSLAPCPTLFDPDAQQSVPLTLDERAVAWIAANPEAVARFAQIALDLHRRGERMGAKGIVEVLRWQHVTTNTDERWLWNNSYTAYIARHVMATWPELAGYFETRCRG